MLTFLSLLALSAANLRAQSVDDLKSESDRAFHDQLGGRLIERKWGPDWPEVSRDALVGPTKPARPPATLADARADASAHRLLERLIRDYGWKTLAGQQGLAEIEYVKSVTGREPAVGAFDLMAYSPSRKERGEEPAATSEQILGWAKRGGIVALCWHWNAPSRLLDQPGGKEWWRGFYTEATTFDLAAAMADPRSKDYGLLVRDIDAIAAELKKFQAAGVPVLWRPLHEAQGGWFWWGAKGADPFVQLWRLMFERLTVTHGLHNLIWVYSPPAGRDGAVDWYPGDEYVDVIGTDIYDKSEMGDEWPALQRHFFGRKLVALTETGLLPNPDQIRARGARWSWFIQWDGDFIRKVPAETLRAVYSDPDIVTLDRLR